MQRPLLKRNNRVVSSEQLSNEKNMLPTYGYIGDEIVQLGMFVYGYLWVIAVYLGYMLPSYVGVEINHLPTGMILQVPSLKLAAKAPENGWLQYCLFSGANC